MSRTVSVTVHFFEACWKCFECAVSEPSWTDESQLIQMKRTKRASTQEGRNYSKSSLNIAINWYISVTDYNCKIEKSFNLAVRTLCWPFWDINLKNWHYFSHIINKLNLLQISYMILKHFVHRTAFKIIGRKEGKKERMKRIWTMDLVPWTIDPIYLWRDREGKR